MLARLKELQRRQQQLNEQLAENNARQSPDPADQQPSPGQKPQGSQPDGQQPGDQQPGDQQPGDQQPGDQPSGDQQPGKAGDAAEQADDQRTGPGEGEAEDRARDGAQEPSDDGPGDTDEAAAEQKALGRASGEVADQLTEMPQGKSAAEANDVAGELRRAASFQENAAAAIVRKQLGEATRFGGEGSAAIAEAIQKLEELVFAGKQSGNEAETYPDGYEQLIQEYLRAISYE